MAKRSTAIVVEGPRDEVFVRCVAAADTLGWQPLSDAGEGGVDVIVPGSRPHLRRQASLEVRLTDVDERANTRVRMTANVATVRLAAGAQAQEIVDLFARTLKGSKDENAAPEPQLSIGTWSPEKLVVRIASIALLLVAIGAACLVDLPKATAQPKPKAGATAQPRGLAQPTKRRTNAAQTKLPDVALGQEEIYRLEIGIVVFYGGLVVLTPFFFGAWRGRFPTEVSARGAAFPDDAAEKVEGSLKGTEDRVDTLARRMTRAEHRLDNAELEEKI